MPAGPAGRRIHFPLSRPAIWVESRLAVFVAITLVYGLLALSAYELFGALSIGVTFFPPAGLTFAAFLLLPRRQWPAVAAGIVVGEVVVDMGQGQPFAWSLGWAAANLAEPFVGACIVRFRAGRLVLGRRFAFWFLVGGLVVGPIVGASIGASVLAVADQLSWTGSFPDIWVGDALGVLVVAPVIMVVARPADFVHNRRPTADLLLVSIITVVVSTVVASSESRVLGYAAVPLLALPAVRYSAREVAVSGVIVASILTAATARGQGPWASTTAAGAQAELVQQQAFLLVALGAAWLLKLEVLDRLRAVTAAQTAQNELEVAQARARDQRHLQAMHSALRDFAGATSGADVLDALVAHAGSVLEADATVVVLDRPDEPLEVASSSGGFAKAFPVGTRVDASPLATAARAGHLVLGEDLESRGGEGATHIAVPLRLATRAGALGLARDAGPPWSETAQIRALAFAAIVAEALDRTERLEVHRSVALTLQHAIMPGEIPTIPGSRVGARYLPATSALEVGGDWYDLIGAPRRGSATVVIGDVVGHNLSAAAAMGKLASAARALAFAGFTPGPLIECLDMVASHTADATMTTLVCAQLDLPLCALRYSLAGHPPPLLRAPGGEVRRLEHARSTPVGVDPRSRRPEETVPTPPGTSILFYTDGLVEQRHIPIDDRLAQLTSAFSDCPVDDPEQTCDQIVDIMLRGHRQEDDVALLCLSVDP